MKNYTREQRGKAFDALSKEIKSVITSNTLAETYQKIGQTHKLNLEKTGIIADTVTLVILNLIPRESIVSELIERLSINTDEATKLTKTINDEIFLKIREILQTEKSNASESLSENEVPVVVSDMVSVTAPEPTRDSILAEIENPTPSIHPITVASAPVSGPAMTREIVTETKETVAHDFIGSKLTETVALPSQKAAVTLKTPTAPESKPKSYSADPYREAIN